MMIFSNTEKGGSAMVSCTEFIPAYSELFAYLEDKNGKEEVRRLWDYLFAPTGDGVPLINFVKKEGIRGCFSYWSGTLNEEAADFTMYLNEKGGWFKNVMHYCPSKGRLLQLKEEIGITPYPDYCLHCDYYRQAVEKVGLEYIFDFCNTDRAGCSIFIYDPNVFDGRIILDENTEIMDRRASDNEYFHRDFHSFMNLGVHYVGEHFGIHGVKEYLIRFTHNVYNSIIADAQKTSALDAVESKIRDTYMKEKALDRLSICREDNTMTITVTSCPAIEHIISTGRFISPWYRYTTEFVMEALAAELGLRFTMNAYDEETGAASYTFAV
jgi:hypothetical protein